MQMRVMQQVLSPGVEDGEEAEVNAEVFRVPGDGEQGFRGGLEQEVVDDLLIVESESGDFFGQSEDDVVILHR